MVKAGSLLSAGMQDSGSGREAKEANQGRTRSGQVLGTTTERTNRDLLPACGKRFEAKRRDAGFCSARCRQRRQRRISEPPHRKRATLGARPSSQRRFLKKEFAAFAPVIDTGAVIM